ncbi:hypothetical protein [Streptomyces sp. NPDC058872]|uniref:hypothetical protein n=1 Tax=Streptomyces sp. NPDC058872 TaxID=3346661 RepID=UPI00369353EB
MAIPLIAAAGAVVKIVHSVYTWTQKTPQGRATLAVASAAAAHQHAKSHPHDGGAQAHAFEAMKKVGEHVVNPTAESLFNHVRTNLKKP